MRLEIIENIDHPILRDHSGFQALPQAFRENLKIVSRVFPFRVNRYVVENLINWQDPQDPIFRLTFPQPGMLSDINFQKVTEAGKSDDKTLLFQTIRDIRMSLNPHPGGQLEKNLPVLKNGEILSGIQHKYRPTVLFFPSEGQTCHSYCTFCFRWPQFIGYDDLKIGGTSSRQLVQYLKEHDEIRDVLITGGDPLIMRAKVLRSYLEAILEANLSNLQSIRIGTKAFTYWPFRFISDIDTEELFDCFRLVKRYKKHLTLVAHFNHPKELESEVVEEAISRVKREGVVIRTQTPILKGINDNADTLQRLWAKQIELGCIPYYLFVMRDTGPQEFFAVPLARSLEVYTNAMKSLCGLARTVRGPVMSCDEGKISIQDVTTLNDRKVFVLQYFQARDADLNRKIFFADYDEDALWIDQLKRVNF